MRYEFRLTYPPSATLTGAFPELEARRMPGGVPVMYGPVVDQAQLHELIARFGDLGVEIVEIRQLPD